MIVWCSECWNPRETGRICACVIRKMAPLWKPVTPSPGVDPIWAKLLNDSMLSMIEAVGEYHFTEYFADTPFVYNTVDLAALRRARWEHIANKVFDSSR